MKPTEEGSVAIEQRIEAPASSVASYVGDFRNAKEWMVGVEGVERLGEDSYRLILESPVGKLEPEVRLLEHGEGLIRWTYVSTIEGGGEVTVASVGNGSSCVVSYTGDFRLKGKVLGRAARFVGMERFARRNGERSLLRLKHLMEARRY
jgi:carbon monoxide dehydrogenase subunit G